MHADFIARLRRLAAEPSFPGSGPTELPKLPPTWKMDCAMPRRPCDASDVMREASGCRVAEPTPTIATATSTMGSDCASRVRFRLRSHG
mgnify:CR=1 FL=1